MRATTLLFFVFCTALATGQVSRSMLRLPDTGQTNSYTTTYGEDNDFLINMPFFTINGDGTVTDTVTGLMWQQTDGGEMTYENALIYCDTMTLGGYTDWQLPTDQEAYSILNHQRTNPAIDITVFTPTAAEYWWTANLQYNDSNKVWSTNSGGGIGNHRKTETISAGGTKHFHVRAVRYAQAPVIVPVHFTDINNEIITDELTGLSWQKSPYYDSLTWEDALLFADTLSLGGYTDWRLPNIKELFSINDNSRSNPSLPVAFFNVAAAAKYWSSTSLPNQTTKAWYINTQFGITTYDVKTNRHEIICVRGSSPLISSIIDFHAETSSCLVYPNPFNAEFSVSWKKNTGRIDLYDALGKKVHSGDISGPVDGSVLPAGIYLLRHEANEFAPIRVIKSN